jgi:hypothetical protein
VVEVRHSLPVHPIFLLPHRREVEIPFQAEEVVEEVPPSSSFRVVEEVPSSPVVAVAVELSFQVAVPPYREEEEEEGPFQGVVMEEGGPSSIVDPPCLVAESFHHE